MRVTGNASIASRIEQAFQTASTSTGTSFDYLVKTATRESSMDPSAKAQTSSATGLFQFIESTWLETVKEAGSKHGLDQYSSAIEKTESGKFVVSDPDMRREILDLRKDPEISSLMAGAFTQKNANYLNRRLGREPNDSELYMAHFLGARGASKLIDAAEQQGGTRADRLFPTQARANQGIFYKDNGQARTTSEVYAELSKMHDRVASPNMVAKSSPVQASQTATASAERANELDGVGPLVLAAAIDGDSSRSLSATASERVLNAFSATDRDDPFAALFRDDGTSREKLLNSNLASAFTATEKSELFTSTQAVEAQLTVQEIGAQQQVEQGPLDLRRFLSFDVNDDQKDILPPA